MSCASTGTDSWSCPEGVDFAEQFIASTLYLDVTAPFPPPPPEIPESSTWAMMFVGFAGLGLAGFRASRRSVTVPA